MELKNNKGLILIYPGYQNDAKKYQYNRIIEEFNKLGITIDKLKVDEVIIDIENGKTNLKLNEYDFCIQLVKDKYISKILNKNNIRCFNSYESIENCDDKMSTYILLSNNDIKMPNTISGTINTGIEKIEINSISEQFKDYVEKKLSYPFIAKKLNSKGGRDIYKVENKTMFNNLINTTQPNNYIFQQYISTNIGKDVRVVVVGGKVVGSFMRVNENDFRSNISLGGKAIPYEAPDEYKKVAEKTAKILALDYCSVDFFLIENDSPMICEVNSDPALCDIEEINKVNVAEIYAKYIYNKIY